MRIGVAALARPTFDVPFAEELAAQAFAALDATGVELVGPRALLFDAAQAREAVACLASEALDAMLLLQVTFTDASMTVEIARTVSAPLKIWAFPEPRAGGRLRLNAFCGLNLALHALGRAESSADYLYAHPGAPGTANRLTDWLNGRSAPQPEPVSASPPARGDGFANGHDRTTTAADYARDKAAAERAIARLTGARIGLVGEHPTGFDTCRYDAPALQALAGIDVRTIPLTDVFERAEAADGALITAMREALAPAIKGLDEVDQPQLLRSIRVHSALNGLRTDHDFAALAVRCWPEMFTEYGCAACGPMAMLNGAKVPAACEADVLGTISQLIVQEIAGEAAWLVDIVDMDGQDDTGVIWHCGSAPFSMRAAHSPAEAQIHSNRRMPLLMQFPLKAGRITLMRLTQARNGLRLLIGSGEVIDRPMSFTGTSGVVRFDGGTSRACDVLLGEGIEHHLAIAYGEHRGALLAVAEHLGIETMDLTR